MTTMPCLSIRQPWAWLIVNDYKDIENRTWRTNFRGRVLIHAGAAMTKADYEACRIFCSSIDRYCPSPEVLQLGGIVGEVTIVDCIEASGSPWFCGPFGFCLAAPKVLPFRPCRGKLGFFQVNS